MSMLHLRPLISYLLDAPSTRPPPTSYLPPGALEAPAAAPGAQRPRLLVHHAAHAAHAHVELPRHGGAREDVALEGHHVAAGACKMGDVRHEEVEIYVCVRMCIYRSYIYMMYKNLHFFYVCMYICIRD